MAYTAGDTILDDEYNAFVNNSSSPFGYNHFAGTGSAQYGLGQSAISTVSAGGTVNASQWNALMTGITNIANHTNDSMTSRSAVSSGDTVAILSAVAADLATLAASVAAGSPNATALTTSSAKQTSDSSSSWYGSHTVEHSVTFANANTMRYFFNAGGKIRVSKSRTGNGGSGGGATTKDSNWTNLYAALGNIDIASQASTRSGSGETLTTNGLANGFHDLGTGYTHIIRLTEATSPYTGNYIDVHAKLNASVGSATVMTIKTTANDGAADDTYTSGNTSGVDATPDRNGTHRAQIFVTSVTNAQGLSSAIAESSTAVVSNSTS
jgi:hypothetical protein